mgnify:CR=1 FL=1
MRKVAIFVEGQTEQIFVKKLLYALYGYDKVEIISEKIRGAKRFVQLKASTTGCPHYFLIVDIGGEPDDIGNSKLLSDMLDNYGNMKNKGFSKILGLRDLYPQKRQDEKRLLDTMEKVIAKQALPLKTCKIRVLLAIMEIESWFLADPNLFENIDTKLTANYIQTYLQYDLLQNDPEIVYDHPANVLEKIYDLAGRHYRKREKDIYQIAESLRYDYLCLDVKQQKKIASFFLFLEELENF